MNRNTIESLLAQRDLPALKRELTTCSEDELIELMRSLAPAQALVVFRLLEKQVALEVFERLEFSEQADLVATLDNPEVIELLAQGDPAEVAQLLDELPAKVVRQVFTSLPPSSRQQLNVLLGYPVDSVGRQIDPRYLAVTAYEKVSAVLEKVRLSELEDEDLEVVFVMSEGRRYIGYIAVARLLRADPQDPIGTVSMETEAVSAYAPVDEVTDLLADLRSPLIAVLDHEQRLVGSLRAADALRLIEEKESARLVTFGGALPSIKGPDIDIRTTSIAGIFSARFVWLAILTCFMMITSSFVASQERLLDEVFILAAFISPIIAMGGNTGSQSATLVIRSFALGHLQPNWRGFWLVLRKDLLVALALGASIAMLETALVFMFKRDIVSMEVMLVVGLTMMLVTILGSLFGLVVPFVARRFGVDPATLSGPAITSMMDLFGVMTYFGVAALFLGHLID